MNFNLNDLKNYAKKIAKEGKVAPLSENLTTSVSGVSFNGRQGLIKVMNEKTPIDIRREVGNVHDKYAVMVRANIADMWWQIGYIPQKYSATVSSLIDSGNKFSARVEKFNVFENDGNLEIKGLDITIEVGG
jgi:hypothetical protein